MAGANRPTFLAALALALLAGCGAPTTPSVATDRLGASPEAAAMRSALDALPEAERREAEEATAISLGAQAPVREDELTPLRAELFKARELLGIAPAFKDEAELVPYLTSLVRVKPTEAYDRAGFLQSLGLTGLRSPGKTDDATFAAVRVVKDYSPGAPMGEKEIGFQVLAWKIARNFPRTYVTLAKAVNPALEATARLRRPWAKPFEVRQTAHPTGQSAAERYAAPAAFHVLFDPDVHSGAPGTQPEGRRAYGTFVIAQSMGFPAEAAARVGKVCNDVDEDGAVPYPKTAPFPMSGIDRHFNLDRGHQDTRYVWAARHLQAAIDFGRKTSWVEAETELGMGLHSLQDSFAHGQLTPYLHGTIGEYPDDLRFNPIGYVEADQATRAYFRAYLDAVKAAR